jgi:hypothetical protein
MADDPTAAPTVGDFAKRLAALRKGDELPALAALREQLADAFMAAPVTVAAQISAQVLKVLEREAVLKGEQVKGTRPKSALDELKAKRKERDGNPAPADRKATRRRP